MADAKPVPDYAALAADELKARFPDGQVPLLIAGEASPGTAAFEVEDPSYGTPFITAAAAGSAEIEAAMRSAAAAIGAWKTSASHRGRLLIDVARKLEQHALALALIETLETGKPVSQSLADARATARYFAYYGGLAESLVGNTIPLDEGHEAYTLRDPYGVTVHIIPWNSPISQFARGVAAALAAGNTAVVKTSQRAPASVVVAATLMLEAGIPAGVCNVVSGAGASTGLNLVRHPATSLVVFTGSTDTGRNVLAAAAERITPCKLELGGKSADLIFDDADLPAAVEGAVASVTRNAGQSCYASTRLLVHDRVYEAYVELLTNALGAIKLGPGIEDPDMGPLSSADHLAATLETMRSAAGSGARLLAGGNAAPASRTYGGHFIEPTLVDGIARDSVMAQRELFAPVLVAFRFRDEEEAVELANATQYGLAAGIYTAQHDRVVRVARRLEAGQVHVNRGSYAGVELPFGGYRRSGIGHEKGLVALEEYARHKSVVSRITRAKE